MIGMIVIALICCLVVCLVAAVAVYFVYSHRSVKGTKESSAAAADAPTTNATATTELPPPSRHDDRCKTDMIPNDTPECFALVYNHCEKEFKDQNRIPEGIRSSKSKILDRMYVIGKNDFGNDKPKDWTTLCMSRPDKVGKGNCKQIKPGEFRVWAKGRGPITDPCLKGGSLYVKAHVNGDNNVQEDKVGGVGHG